MSINCVSALSELYKRSLTVASMVKFVKSMVGVCKRLTRFSRAPSKLFQESTVFFYNSAATEGFCHKRRLPHFHEKGLQNIVSVANHKTLKRAPMLDCRCYGQHSHEKESRTETRSEPFIPAVFVFDKTCPYKWYIKTRLVFPRINGPNV